MRRKLSQPAPSLGASSCDDATTRPASQPAAGHPARRLDAATLHSRSIVAALTLLALALACSSTDPASNDDSALDGSLDASADRSESINGDFRWPTEGPALSMQLEVETSDETGIIEIQLLPALAPTSVEAIVRLAREGHYDGTTFHRVIRGFMIQGGDPNSRDPDPTNDGRGGANVDLPDELSAAPFERGIVALANRGRKGSNSSQFFILQADHRDLDGRYTAFGRVTRGIEFVDLIANTPTDKVGRWGPKDRPIESVSIRRVQISGPDLPADTSAPAASPKSPALRLSHRPAPETQ